MFKYRPLSLFVSPFRIYFLVKLNRDKMESLYDGLRLIYNILGAEEVKRMSTPSISKTEIREHVRMHLKYPATKRQLVEACNNMSDIPKADREWFAKSLPEGTYKSPDDVIKALRL